MTEPTLALEMRGIDKSFPGVHALRSVDLEAREGEVLGLVGENGAGELDLEAATEFLVLIAALLELKSRLMLPADEEEGLDIEPVEAAEELLARLLEYHRYRQAAEHLRERLGAEHGFRYRSAPLPPQLRRISVEAAEAAYEPERLAEALGGLLIVPPPLDLRHVRRPAVSVEQRLRHLRDLLASRSRFSFDDAVRGADRLTEAVTLFALLELYKAGEAKWEQEVPFGPITVVPAAAPPAAERAEDAS